MVFIKRHKKILSVADLGEMQLISRIKKQLNTRAKGVICGIGDDAAVLANLAPSTVLSCDMLVEDVDFKLSWAKAADIGHKAAAVNLSDIAAMGAAPRGLLAALALPGDMAVRDVMTLLRTLHRFGSRFGAPLVGGDISATRGPLIVSVTAVGAVDSHRTLWRGRAQEGDAVFVSGGLGGAAAGLALLMSPKKKHSMTETTIRRLTRHQLRPMPRVNLGQLLGKAGGESGIISAAADISDGITRDALHLPVSGCGVEIDVDRLPWVAGVQELATIMKESAVQWALSGGEDFELVFSAAPKYRARVAALAHRAGVKVTEVGRIIRGSGLHLIGKTAPSALPSSYEHFRTVRK